MWIHFFLENAHFALNIFGALVMFAVAWLYFDAFLARKSKREGIRTAGFFLLSLSFIAGATIVESNLITASIIPPHLHIWLFTLTRIPGFLCIIWSLILDPIQPKPKTEELLPTEPPPTPADPRAIPSASVPAVVSATGSGSIIEAFTISALPYLLSPLLAFGIGSMYLQHATTGLERHLKRVSLSFLLLGLSELFALRTLFLTTERVDVYQLVAPFGVVWMIQHALLLVSLTILCRWVFGYLLKRFETQLFMIFTIMILCVFLITTVTFTGLLVKNLVDQTLAELTTNARVLEFSFESKKQEILSDTELFAQSPALIENVQKNERRILVDQITPHLLSHKLTSLIVVNKDGTVLAMAEDPDRFGYSISDDPLVRQALSGQHIVSVVSQEGTITPNLVMKAATPVLSDSTIIGAVISSSLVDTALLDGIKKATGLEASIYTDTRLSATTLLSPDGVTRPIGTQEQRPQIRITVLKEAKPFVGGINLLNRPYFASYLPILDATNVPVGMLFIGKPQATVLATAGRSIELTFLVTVVLLIVSVIPAYLVSRFIVKQIR